jgi:hypothetical protein
LVPAHRTLALAAAKGALTAAPSHDKAESQEHFHLRPKSAPGSSYTSIQARFDSSNESPGIFKGEVVINLLWRSLYWAGPDVLEGGTREEKRLVTGALPSRADDVAVALPPEVSPKRDSLVLLEKVDAAPDFEKANKLFD